MKTQQKQGRKPLHHQAKKLLVPHKANQYRPHLIRLPVLTAVLVVAILAQLTYSFLATGTVSVLSKVSDINTNELLAGTNVERQKVGLNELRLNEQLSQAAFLKGQDMLANDYWAHVSPTGVEPWKWLGDVGYNYSYAGENLAKNYPSAGATVDAWMNSESHRANILNTQYVDVGFAVVDGDLAGENTTLVVALYGAPVVAAAPAPQGQGGEASAVPAGQQSAFTTASVSQAVQEPIAYVANSLRSLSPVAIAVLGVLAIVAIVGAVAHHHRHKLPKSWKKSWRKHHGMYTFIGTLSLGVLIILATGGGQL